MSGDSKKAAFRAPTSSTADDDDDEDHCAEGGEEGAGSILQDGDGHHLPQNSHEYQDSVSPAAERLPQHSKAAAEEMTT